MKFVSNRGPNCDDVIVRAIRVSEKTRLVTVIIEPAMVDSKSRAPSVPI